MKLPVRILLALLCAAMVLSVPFVVSSPRLLEDAQWEIIDEIDSLNSDDDAAFLSWLIPAASAEEKQYSLPVDTTPGMKPNQVLHSGPKIEFERMCSCLPRTAMRMIPSACRSKPGKAKRRT